MQPEDNINSGQADNNQPAKPESLGVAENVNSTVTEVPADSAANSTPALSPKTNTPKKNSFLARFTRVQLIAILMVFGVSAYFGVIVPNSPENVWKSSMENTSKGLDKLVAYADKGSQAKGSKFDGSFKADVSGVLVDGSFNGAMYEKNSDVKADVGAAGTRVNIELLTHVPENANNPDIYVRLKGVSQLGNLLGQNNPQVTNLLNSINNQWFVIDHTAVDQYASSATNTTTKTPSLSSKDIVAIQKAVVKASKENLFTSDSSESPVQIVRVVGNEKVNDYSTIHYEVTVNKQNLKAYLTKLKDELKNTKLSEFFQDESFEKAIQFDEMLKSVDEMDTSKTFDVWVDKSAKIIRKVQFSDKESKSYLEFLVSYNGGNKYPFELGLYNKDSGGDGGENTSMVLKLELDSSNNKTTMQLNIDAGKTATAQIKASTEPSNEEVEFTKPEDAKSLTELLGMAGGLNNVESEVGLPTTTGLGQLDF